MLVRGNSKVFKIGHVCESKKIVGRADLMADFIWHWREGSTKIYTKKEELAEKAMKKGFLVIGKKATSHYI